MDEQAYQRWLDAPDERKVFRVWRTASHNSGEMPLYTDVPYHRGIGEVREGFWVNEDWQWTCGSDAEHWIPPSSFGLVSKVLLPDSAGDDDGK
jgi:hypothetical protein